MSSSLQIRKLREKQKELSTLVDKAYAELANTDEYTTSVFSLNGLELMTKKVINKTLSLVSHKPSDLQLLKDELEAKPTKSVALKLLNYSRQLLAKRLNHEAVTTLKLLYARKYEESYTVLGNIFMNGVKNKIGVLEYKHPQNALKCLQKGMSCGNIESTYLLGILYKNFGQTSKAKAVFEKNIEKGCVKSITEVIILLQLEAATCDNQKQAAIIKQKIKNLRTDLTYAPN